MKNGPLEVVESKTSRIPIYAEKHHGKDTFLVIHYAAGERKPERFPTLEAAREHAKSKIKDLATGTAHVGTFTPRFSFESYGVVTIQRYRGYEIERSHSTARSVSIITCQIFPSSRALLKRFVDAIMDGQGKPLVKIVHNGLRHSFITYRMATEKSAAAVSLEAGNSPRMIFQHYRELATEAQGRAWFNVAFYAIRVTKKILLREGNVALLRKSKRGFDVGNQSRESLCRFPKSVRAG